MEHIENTAHAIALKALLHLELDDLNRIYHAECDKMVDADLHSELFTITEPVMEYFIDGIDEAADDEQQTNLKTLVCYAILQMQSAILADDIRTAREA